ncbi:MAG: hypothetical protein RLZZ164_900 [Actinomycetota bacterium]
MKRIRHIAAIIGWAGLVSFFSLLAAWFAIYLVITGHAALAIQFAVAAFLLDATDGYIARKLGKDSNFGRQLDGMIDAINYSLLAALVTALVLLPGWLGFAVGFLILSFGILRLVLFNIDGYLEQGDVRYYTGVVTPHLSLACVLFYFVEHFVTVPAWLIATVLVVLALGQISTIKVRKTGALLFWVPASIAIAIGALFWR